MASFYLDTSVLLSAYLPDVHSSKVLSFLSKHKGFALSMWNDLEFRGALGLHVRQGLITQQQAERVLARYQRDRQRNVYMLVELSSQHFQAALDSFLSFASPLKSADALHVGVSRVEKLKLVTLDEKQAKVARQVKVKVVVP
jgi:predicted nucleic acid-binding protein